MTLRHLLTCDHRGCTKKTSVIQEGTLVFEWIMSKGWTIVRLPINERVEGRSDTFYYCPRHQEMEKSLPVF